MQIDLVYLWCDGSDENFIKTRQFWAEKLGVEQSKANNKCRFFNNDELKYSLRSAEMYAPWINKIFIVTNGQVPTWLDVNHPKIKIVKHSDIIPEKYLPSFNSSVIENYIPFIPELSEYFLYANDDMFFAAPVTPEDFFDKAGKPIIHLSPCAWSENMRKNHHHANNVTYSQNLCYNKFGVKYDYEPHHNVDAYRKSYWLECLKEFADEFEKLSQNKFRAFEVMQRSLVSYYTLANYGATLFAEKSWTKLRLKKTIFGVRKFSVACNITNFKTLFNVKTKLICINDTEAATDEDRKRARKFFDALFYVKAPWELN